MATSLGSLVVSLGLNAAEFTVGLNKSEYQVKQLAEKLEKGLVTASRVAAGAIAGIGTAAAGAYAAVVQLAGQAGNFKDLEEKTGASAEALARFAISASVTGTPVETIAAAMNKMSKGLVSVEDETKDAGAALEALGLNVNEFKQLAPDQQILALAKAFTGFADGSGKSAAAMAIMGRAGAELLPFMKELAGETDRATKLTQQQIERADEFADKQARATAELRQYLQALATEALPVITSTIRGVKDFIETLVGVNNETKKLDVAKIREWAETVVIGFSKVVDAGDGVVRVVTGVGKALGAQFAILNTTGSFSERIAATKSIIADLTKDLDGLASKPFLSRTLENRFTADAALAKLRDKEDRGFTPKLPQVNFRGADKDKASQDAAAFEKAIFDGRIKELENFIKREQEILNAREAYLSDVFQQGFTSITAYYDDVAKLRSENLAKTIDAYDREIDAAMQLRLSLTKESELQGNDNKIAEIREKQADAIRKAGFEADKFERDRSRANQEWAQQLDELSAKSLELRGATAAAGLARFDSQTSLLRRRLNANGAGTADLDFQRQAAYAQELLNQKVRDYGQLLDYISVQNQRASQAVAAGQLSELESLQFISKNAQEALPAVKAAIDEATASALLLAQTLGADSPATKAALIGLEQLKTKYLEIANTGDLVARKFNDIFSNAIEQATTKFLDSTKPILERAKDFFKDISNSVVKDVTQVALKDLLQKGFGQGGPLSFLGEGFAKLFGFSKEDPLNASSIQLMSAGTLLNTAGGQLNVAAAQLLVAAGTLSASSAGGSAGGISSFIASLFGGGGAGPMEIFNPGSAFQGPSFGFAASGTDYWRGGPLVVGENGPEVMWTAPVGARVTPTHRMGAAGSTTIINQTIPRGADTRSVRQSTLAGVYQAQSGWKRR